VIARTTQSKPAGATHWSRSRMALEVGISESSVVACAWTEAALWLSISPRPARKS
jgi:hypothetical protein